VTTDTLSYTLDAGIAIIRMDDGKANALSMEMIEGLLAALERAGKEAGAILLTGRPERFCAGFDLRVMMSGPDAAMALLRRGGDLLMGLYGSPLPLVIACTGHAIAGGALVLLTGDVRFGAPGAFRIGLNEVSIGLPVPVLAMELARDRIAQAELGRATLFAQMYDPEEAARVGYLDAVVAEAALLERAKAEAVRLAGFSRGPFVATKQRLRGRTIAHIKDTLEDDMRRLMAPG
jgi:enoyl-CoA hydratase